MKCPNCGHVFQPDEDEEHTKLAKGVFYPGVQLKEK